MADETRSYDVEAMLALALTAKPPAGPCPTIEQLAAWHDGTLERDEADAVGKHVAQCNECFATWSALIESADLLAEPAKPPPEPTRWSWLPPFGLGLRGGALAAGVALIATVAVVVPILPQSTLEARIANGFEHLAMAGATAQIGEQWPWPDGYQTRSTAGAEVEAAIAFRAGLADGLRQAAPATGSWQATIASLAESDDPCQGAEAPDRCATVVETMFDAGRWAALLYVACAAADASGTTLTNSFWKDQLEVLDEFAERTSEVADSAFARLFAQWQASASRSDDARQAACERHATLITLGLST